MDNIIDNASSVESSDLVQIFLLNYEKYCRNIIDVVASRLMLIKKLISRGLFS